METRGKKIAQAARACVGARFRPQGRDAAIGLDCVGLAGLALVAGGVRILLPNDYALRGSDPMRIVRKIENAGLRPVAREAASEGDLLLVAAGPAQWHVLVLTAAGFVHADAGLRRVVETPGPPRWPVFGAWRVYENDRKER